MPCYTPPCSRSFTDCLLHYLIAARRIVDDSIHFSMTSDTASTISLHKLVGEMLCVACKKLTREQIRAIIDPQQEYISLLEWYTSHILGDIANNTEKDREEAIKEAERIGINMQYALLYYEGTKLVKWEINNIFHL